MTSNASQSAHLRGEHGPVPALSTLTGFEAVPRTFPQMLADRAEYEPNSTAFCSWIDGAARPTTWREYLQQVQEVALGLHSLGIVAGDRVAIMSSARGEWVVSALAILSAGAIPVGVYPTSSVTEVEQALTTTGATAIFAEGAPDIAKAVAVAERVGLRVIVGYDTAPADVPPSVTAVTFTDIRAAGKRRAEEDPGLFNRLVEAGNIDQIAALFFTSGSTGTPKGVTHTHRTLQYSVLAFGMSYPQISESRHDLVGFLGLSHVAPALIGVFTPIMTRLVVTYCTMDQRAEALAGVRPTAVLWPPRMHEKLASEMLQTVAESNRAMRLRYSAAMQVARRVHALRGQNRAVPMPLSTLYALCLKQVFLPLRAKIGMDRIRVSWTASGSMPPEVTALWHMWGLDLRELFGTTETCGSVIAQWDRAFPRPGTIGKSMPDPRWQIRVSPEGELQVKAPLLFTGYWGKPEAYTEAFTDDGWYSTGDLVELSDDGEVRIIGRLKDILITSGGKTISPQPIEVRLKASSLIDEAIVVGEGRKYLTVLLSVSDTANAMASHERTAALTDWIEEVNAELARPLQLKKFRVLPRALTSEMGELTLKGTIRRANVLNSFKALVDEMYDDDEQLQIARQARLAETDQR